MPEPDVAVDDVVLVLGHSGQPVVRPGVLAPLPRCHVVRRAAVQRGHHRGRDAAPVRGRESRNDGRRVHVPRVRGDAAVRRAPQRRVAVPGQQPFFRVVRQTVPAEHRVRRRHAHAT